MSFPLKLLLMPTQNLLHSETYRTSEVSSQEKKNQVISGLLWGLHLYFLILGLWLGFH